MAVVPMIWPRRVDADAFTFAHAATVMRPLSGREVEVGWRVPPPCCR